MDNIFETQIGKIELKRAKVKQVKSLIKEVSNSVDDGIKLFKKPMDENKAVEVIVDFALEKWDIFEEYILSLTSISAEEFNELDILEASGLIKVLIEYNGIKSALIKSFFQNLKLAQEERTQTSFVQEIPMEQ